MKKLNPHFLAFMTLVALYFLWWLSGGSFLGVVYKPSPLDVGTAFVIDNFKLGASTIFESFYWLINK